LPGTRLQLGFRGNDKKTKKFTKQIRWYIPSPALCVMIRSSKDSVGASDSFFYILNEVGYKLKIISKKKGKSVYNFLMAKKTSSKIPKSLQWVLWSADVEKLDKEKDKYYIIHQILIYGGIEELRWLFANYSREEIINVFLQPYKNYPKKIFYFVKNFILNLKNKKIDEDAYVTTIYGPIRPRAARSF